MAKYSENCDKVISKAIPTVNSEGIVLSWEIEVTYSYPASGITTTDTQFRKKFETKEDVEYLNKTVDDFTKGELFSFLNIAQYNMVFDSSYESVVLPPVQTRYDSFNINLLQD